MRGITTALIAATAVAAGTLSAPAATARVDASSEYALVGPVRYTESAGIQTPVWGASFVVIGDLYAENTITADDTIVMTLNGATTGSATMWMSRTNRLFPTDGGLADDTLTLLDPTSTPAAIGSGDPFNVIFGGNDDTILQTYIGVNSPGTYAGDVYIYEGSVPTMSAASVVQHTTFNFTTARAPKTITVDPDNVQLVATAADEQYAVVQVLDDSGNPTQLTTSDQIVVTTTNATIANPTVATLDATSFDDSLIDPLGSATFAIDGGSNSGSATVTLTPQGTLPSSGVTATTISADSYPLSAKSPGLFEMVFPTDQVVFDADLSTDDTAYYTVNDQFITNVLLVAEGADANSGIVGYVTTSNSDWAGLYISGGGRSPVEQVPNASTDVPVVLSSGSGGDVAAALTWNSVTEGGRVTLRTGSGSNTKWTVIDVEEAVPEPKTSPAGRIMAKSGEPIDFIVRLVDDFGNAFPQFRVQGQARSSRGTPLGPTSSWATTDSTGRAQLSVPPPDDTYAGTATISFVVTLPSGLPYPALSPANVRVTYSESGAATALTVAQPQSVPSTISPTTVQQAIPYVVVPYSGTAAVSNGAPGTWTLPTPAAPDASGTPNGTMAMFTPTSVPASQIEVTAPEGVYLTTRTTSGWDQGQSSIEVDSGTPVYAYSTAVGTHTIEFAAGTLVTKATLQVATTPNAAYSVEASPTTIQGENNSLQDCTLLISDPFGNPVTDFAGLQARLTTSAGFFGNGSNLMAISGVDNTGRTRFSLLLNDAGDESSRTVDVSMAGGLFDVGSAVPSGLPQASRALTIPVEIIDPSPQQSIQIVGERTTVRGKPGIDISGTSDGLDDSNILTPWLRLPGQSDFTAGKAAIRPDADGDFEWQRKTGKKVTVYVATSDGVVRSNRVTIP